MRVTNLLLFIIINDHESIVIALFGGKPSWFGATQVVLLIVIRLVVTSDLLYMLPCAATFLRLNLYLL